MKRNNSILRSFPTHTEQTIQARNQSLCEVRSNLTIISKPKKSFGTDIANVISYAPFTSFGCFAPHKDSANVKITRHPKIYAKYYR